MRLTKYDAQNLAREHRMNVLPEETHRKVLEKEAEIFAQIEAEAKKGETITWIDLYPWLDPRAGFLSVFPFLWGFKKTPEYYEIVNLLTARGYRCRPIHGDDDCSNYARLEIRWD